jgi:hypothetical protein
VILYLSVKSLADLMGDIYRIRYFNDPFGGTRLNRGRDLFEASALASPDRTSGNVPANNVLFAGIHLAAFIGFFPSLVILLSYKLNLNNFRLANDALKY